MQQLFALSRLAVRLWLAGNDSAVSLVRAWYRRRCRLKKMLERARGQAKSLEETIWEAYAAVERVNQSLIRLEAAQRSAGAAEGVMDDFPGLCGTRELWRSSLREFEAASGAFAGSVLAAEKALRLLGSLHAEAQRSFAVLAWLNARIARRAPHSVFRILWQQIEQAGSFLKDAHRQYSSIPAELADLHQRFSLLKQAPFKA